MGLVSALANFFVSVLKMAAFANLFVNCESILGVRLHSSLHIQTADKKSGADARVEDQLVYLKSCLNDILYAIQHAFFKSSTNRRCSTKPPSACYVKVTPQARKYTKTSSIHAIPLPPAKTRRHSSRSEQAQPSTPVHPHDRCPHPESRCRQIADHCAFLEDTDKAYADELFEQYWAEHQGRACQEERASILEEELDNSKRGNERMRREYDELQRDKERLESVNHDATQENERLARETKEKETEITNLKLRLALMEQDFEEAEDDQAELQMTNDLLQKEVDELKAYKEKEEEERRLATIKVKDDVTSLTKRQCGGQPVSLAHQLSLSLRHTGRRAASVVRGIEPAKVLKKTYGTDRRRQYRAVRPYLAECWSRMSISEEDGDEDMA